MNDVLGYRGIHGRFTHPVYYCYDCTSLRGVDISQERDYIEVRVTVLSSSGDWLLARQIVRLLHKFTGGRVEDEQGAPARSIQWDPEIHKLQEEDIEAVSALLQDGREVKLFGPFGAYNLDAGQVIPLLTSNEHVYHRMARLENLLKQPYQTYFDMLRP